MSARIVGCHPAPARDGCGSDEKHRSTLQICSRQDCDGNQKDFGCSERHHQQQKTKSERQDERSKVRDGQRFGTATSYVTCADARSQRPKELSKYCSGSNERNTCIVQVKDKKFLLIRFHFHLFLSFVLLVGSCCLLSRIKLKSIKVDILQRRDTHRRAHTQ